MDERPIGVFDSGLGGLTAVRELRKRLPGEKIIYFGDTGRVPYGTRSRETIVKYARQDIRFLRTFDLKAIVVACGTVSTTALEILREENEIPVFGVVQPAASLAAQSSALGEIGLIATSASIRSGAYEKIVSQTRPDARVSSVPCPLFVPLVENGRFRKGDPVIEQVAREYLAPLKEKGVDVLILGCTHYPLLSEVIGEIMGEQVKLVDAGAACAAQVERYFAERGLFAPPGSTGSCRYYVSDSQEDFSRLASIFLQNDITGRVEQIAIENY